MDKSGANMSSKVLYIEIYTQTLIFFAKDEHFIVKHLLSVMCQYFLLKANTETEVCVSSRCDDDCDCSPVDVGGLHGMMEE